MSRHGLKCALRFHHSTKQRYAAAVERPWPPLWRRLLTGFWRWC